VNKATIGKEKMIDIRLPTLGSGKHHVAADYIVIEVIALVPHGSSKSRTCEESSEREERRKEERQHVGHYASDCPMFSVQSSMLC